MCELSLLITARNILGPAGDGRYGGHRQETGPLLTGTGGPSWTKKGTVYNQSPSYCRADELYGVVSDSLGDGYPVSPSYKTISTGIVRSLCEGIKACGITGQ